LRSQKGSRERLVSSFKGELEDFEALVQQGYAEKQKVRELERSLAQSEGQLGELVSNVAATSLQISETKLKILQLQKELQREVAKELAEVQVDLFGLHEKMQSMQDMVTRTVVRAPQAGTVLDLTVHTLGAVVRPGAKLLDIVPQGERLIVEAKVRRRTSTGCKSGEVAEIRFSAFKMRDTPKVEGKLVALSADRLVDRSRRAQDALLPRARGDPATGVAGPDATAAGAGRHMPAEVLINTGERTLLGYLLDPMKNTFARSFIED
jgi:epimerase transport system membrane fusion protein